MPAPTTDHVPVSVALVGAGPRGTSVLERLCASAPELLPPGADLTVHVIDPSPPGPGRVWRPNQSPDLLMNTVASQVTLFTDETVDCSGPVRPGPSLHEWARGEWGAHEETGPDATRGAGGGRGSGDRRAGAGGGPGPGDLRAETGERPGPRDRRAETGERPGPGDRGAGAAGGPGPGDQRPRTDGVPGPRQISRSGGFAGPGDPLGPDDYPSRAQYGRYLEWVFAQVVRQAPGAVRVEVHAARAVRLDDGADGRQTVTLDDGTALHGLSAVVLAQGHLPVVADAARRRHSAHAERHGLHHVPPANPADVDLSCIRPHEPVLLRGLGLNFFDHMALLTTGRGGRFAHSDTGGLRYLPSGNEPRLYAGSRRGIPYQARGDNAKGPYGRHLPRVLTDDTIARFRKRADSGEAPDFLTEIWPLVAKEVETVYYEALVSAGEFGDRFLGTAHRSPEETAVLDEFGVPHADRWSWDRISRPYAGLSFTGPGTWRAWLIGHLRRDAAEAALGNVAGPLKAALDVLRDLRNELRQIVDHRGLAGPSRRDHLDRWYTPLNAFLSIGPPRRRIEELTALIEAGTVEVLGPRLEVREEDGAWLAGSPEVPGSAVRVTALIEARLPEPDLRHTADDLLARLLKTGQCRPHTVDGHETGGLDVSRRPYRLIDRQGRVHTRRFAFGVPTEGVHWVTAAGARPGVDSVTLSDADAVARAVLRAAASETEGTAEANRWPNVELASID
ncbi:FAD/NAD(P)-binding protein [Streptomyces sp. NPDC019531]|uniref:FAD/NAD(P)-binding protein n=1 Tax=Streptomyces sp. NPDC019531 TaxID=3365062 RepID=UPI0038516F69